MKIKICGVRTPEVAIAAAETGADFIGLVFVPQSPRYVTIDQACVILRAIAGKIATVGIFRDQAKNEILDVVNALWGSTRQLLTQIQLHGTSRQALQDCINYRSICAIAFDDAIRAQLAAWGTTGPDRNVGLHSLLIDAPDSAGLGGGTGNAVDWKALRNTLDHCRVNVPLFLAGGLTPDNVAEAIQIVRPWGVDVSSGVESSRGVKDIGKIRAFCDAVRSAPV